MAEQLSLVVRDDFINDLGTLDLLPLLNYNGWQMVIGDGDTPVDEALQLHIAGTSDDDLAARLQALEAMLVRVRQFQNPLEPYGVWLRHQMPGETGARQALIVQAQADKVDLTDVQAVDHYIRELMLGLRRTPAWEETAYTTKTAAALGTIGDMADLGAVAGILPARLARTRIDDTHGGNSPFSNVWLGLRSNRFGIAAQFVPRWEAELGHLDSGLGAAVTSANDATATGGQEIEYTETPTLTAGAFAIAHPPVKPGAIEITAVIAGNSYVLTEHWQPYVGNLSTETLQVTGEVNVDYQFDHPLIRPGSVTIYNTGIVAATDINYGELNGVDSSVDAISGTDTGTLSDLPIAGSVVVYDSVPTEIARDDGHGNLVDGLQSVGTIDYATGEWTYENAFTGTIHYTYLAALGTINYVTGAWTWTAPEIAATADYNYGMVNVTFDYETGLGQFIDTYLISEITGITVVYTGYHNKSVRVTFTDPTLQVRWWMSVEEAAEFPADQAGKMLVLGRFKVSDGTTVCRVRLESGFDGTTAYNKRGRVVVSGSDWVIYPLGQVSFSESGRGLRGLDLIAKQRLRIAAERYSGSGTLDFDGLILIPTDEGFISLEAETALESLITPVEYPLLIGRSADDRVMAAGYQTESGQAKIYYSDLQVQVTGGLPIGDHVQLICAAQRSLGSLLQDEVEITLDVYRRWKTLRGAA